jgi:hypothetical protein
MLVTSSRLLTDRVSAGNLSIGSKSQKKEAWQNEACA